jgi:tetratricopeptide (TPR) repeat protein
MSVAQLDLCKGKSPKGFFYLGLALYKLGAYDQAIKAYVRSAELNPNDAQLHYNLGLAYFKEEKYSLSVEHLKLCT